MSDDSILAALTRLETGQTAMANRLNGLDANLSSVKDSLTTVRSDLMEHMDGLENKLTEVRDDIAVNFGALDQARRPNDNTRDELRGLNDVLSRMMTLILRLQTDSARSAFVAAASAARFLFHHQELPKIPLTVY